MDLTHLIIGARRKERERERQGTGWVVPAPPISPIFQTSRGEHDPQVSGTHM